MKGVPVTICNCRGDPHDMTALGNSRVLGVLLAESALQDLVKCPNDRRELQTAISTVRMIPLSHVGNETGGRTHVFFRWEHLKARWGSSLIGGVS